MRLDVRSLAQSALLAIASMTTLAMSSAAAKVAAQSGFAGTYRASPQRIEAVVTTWGEDCGPRPQSTVLNDQPTVTVTDVGSHLSLRFPDRTLRTDACWSPNPAVKLASSAVVNKRYQADCKTSPGDAKREQGRYVVVASGAQLELVEESQYDWQLKESHCVARVKMTQTLTNKEKPVDASVPDAVVAAPAAEETAEKACVPGAPVRLRLRPSESRIAPGDRVCFNAKGFDAAGCAVDIPESSLTFHVAKPHGAEGAMVGSCFKAAGNAALAEGLFKISASRGNMRADVTVSVSAPDLSDITARRGPSKGGTIGGGTGSNETVLESGIRAVASGSHGLLWLAITIAGLAAVLSLVAIVALRLVKKRATAAKHSYAEPAFQEPARPLPPANVVAPRAAPAPAASAAPPSSSAQRICPRCRRGYAPGTERCSNDGTALLDYVDFVKQAEPKAAYRHCPECGAQLAPDSVFCGSCGHKVAQ